MDETSLPNILTNRFTGYSRVGKGEFHPID